MVPPKHIISAAAIVVYERNEILLIKGPRRGWEMPGGQVEEGESLKDATTPECLEAGFFPIKEALEMVTWKNFRQRIEFCLHEELHPFYIAF